MFFLDQLANRSRHEDRVFHSMEELFICGADGRERAPQVGFSVEHEIVWAEPHPAAHRVERRTIRREEGLLDEAAFVEALQDVGMMRKALQRVLYRGLPIALWRV